MGVAVARPPRRGPQPPGKHEIARLSLRYGSHPSLPTAPSVELRPLDPRTSLLQKVAIAATGGAVMIRDTVSPSRNPQFLLSVQGESLADDAVLRRSPTWSRSRQPSLAPSSRHASQCSKEDSTRSEPQEETGGEQPMTLVVSPLELPEFVSEGSRNCWSAIAPSAFKVRGASYLQDRVKVEAPLLSQCLAVEVFRAKKAVSNVAGRPDSPMSTISQRCEQPLKKIFVVVIVIPTGHWVVHIAMYFGVYASIDTLAPCAATLFDRFCERDDAFRNMRFKVFTKVAKGPLPVRLATPQRPAISGRSVPHHYHITPNYVEVDMDVSRDPTAARALHIMKPVTRLLVVDVGFIIEGQQEDELPEMVFGAARLLNMNISDSKVPQIYPDEALSETSSRRSRFSL